MPRCLPLPFALMLALAACGASDGTNAPAPAPQAEAGGAGEAPGDDMAGTRAQRGLIRDFAGSTPPDIEIETGPDGPTTTIAALQAANPGMPMLVNLWATWCAPCLKELPTLDALAADTKGRLLVIPVSQDMEGWRKVSPAFSPEKYPNLSTLLESQTLLGAELKAQGLPLTILYGPDGREVWRYAGDRDWNSADSSAVIGL
jgi:thiol-disulfide isomerase/thioredoxin